MYERLPTPYGLVRYGVAPDHPEVKNCQHKFDELGSDPRFRYFGNVSVGTQSSSSSFRTSPLNSLSEYTYPHAVHVGFSEILPFYSGVLLTYGASLSNPLSNVAGSSSSPDPLEGVFPALALVGWYNGHPAFSHLRPDLRNTKEVAVIGHGNVALDVSRILLKSPQSLEETDLPQSVLDVLGESKVEKVSTVGRRGPAQVSFTTKEFREMLNLPDVAYAGLGAGEAVEQARGMVEGDRMRKRLLGLMESVKEGEERVKRFDLGFLRSPKAFLSSSSSAPSSPGSSTTSGQRGRVTNVQWDINELLVSTPTPTTQSQNTPKSQEGSIPRPTVVARPTGQTETTTADMVVESVGYRSEPLGVGEEWILPFDESRGRVRNEGGRVVDRDGLAVSVLQAYITRGSTTDLRSRASTPQDGQQEAP